MTSILFETHTEHCSTPSKDTLQDLHLDVLIQRILKLHPSVAMNTFYTQVPQQLQDILFRNAVMRDLENDSIQHCIREFLYHIHEHHVKKTYSTESSQPIARMKWYLDAMLSYTAAVDTLNHGLRQCRPQSKGLQRFTVALHDYIETPEHQQLSHDIISCQKAVTDIQYHLHIDWQKQHAIVTPGHQTADFHQTLVQTFAAFSCDIFEKPISAYSGMTLCQFEQSIIEALQQLYPNAFTALALFCEKHNDFHYALIRQFEEEVQFYVAYMDYIEKFRRKGYPFCYPTFSSSSAMRLHHGYNLNIAEDLIGQSPSACSIEFTKTDIETLFIVSGAHQSGKTTYIQTIGQILYLAALGLPVPCQQLDTHLIHRFVTHFSKDENMQLNYGRLKEELVRIRDILHQSNEHTLILCNEPLTSTTQYDAHQIGQRIIHSMLDQDQFCLFVTHMPEMGKDHPQIVQLQTRRDLSQGIDIFQTQRTHPSPIPFSSHYLDQYNLYTNQIKERIQ